MVVKKTQVFNQHKTPHQTTWEPFEWLPLSWIAVGSSKCIFSVDASMFAFERHYVYRIQCSIRYLRNGLLMPVHTRFDVVGARDHSLAFPWAAAFKWLWFSIFHTPYRFRAFSRISSSTIQSAASIRAKRNIRSLFLVNLSLRSNWLRAKTNPNIFERKNSSERTCQACFNNLLCIIFPYTSRVEQLKMSTNNSFSFIISITIACVFCSFSVYGRTCECSTTQVIT